MISFFIKNNNGENVMFLVNGTTEWSCVEKAYRDRQCVGLGNFVYNGVTLNSDTTVNEIGIQDEDVIQFINGVISYESHMQLTRLRMRSYIYRKSLEYV
uniref:Ubiquitin-2 like Rad60 SUMO-like protein n=1 Tax=Pithovirus LCPAC101 TaxID=2506586 RepID=A0A481Z2I6_9VIRU|nr:MAG: ubiquitin-2 like Rad60 SUMO-like protein [Pithovirus LCPAC101]